eukprot:8002602-Lingulodinium_polyedra.AAC.1
MSVRFGRLKQLLAPDARFLVEGQNALGHKVWKAVGFDEFRALGNCRHSLPDTGIVEVLAHGASLHYGLREQNVLVDVDT